MRRILWSLAGAILMVSLLTGPATANRSIETEPLQLFTAASTELVFSEAGGLSIRCAVTLRGSLHQRIAKVAGTLAGFIVEGRTERCRDNLFGLAVTFIILAERGGMGGAPPWHVTYNSFAGTLPNIASILTTFNRAAFLIGNAIWECLYQGNIGTIGRDRAGGANRIDTLELQAGRNTASLFARLRGECPRELAFTGRFTVTVAIRLRLV